MKDIIIGTCEKCGQNFAHNCRCKYKPMNNTTYTANENCFLIDGEVYLVDGQSLVNIKSVPVLSKVQKIMKWRIGSVEVWYLQNGNLAFRITHSTKPLDGVKLLPRDKFVKPVDVEAMASKHLYDNYIVEQLMPVRIDRIKEDFYAGHNANPNEFSYGEAVDLIKEVIAICTTTDYNGFDGGEAFIKSVHYLNRMKPLSLPASVEINEQGEIVNVIW